jgi:hypothetical protein
VSKMGCAVEQQVLEGRLDYKEMERLSEADEKIFLRAMVQTFLDRALCLREQTPAGTMLVFPSYFRRERPELPGAPERVCDIRLWRSAGGDLCDFGGEA